MTTENNTPTSTSGGPSYLDFITPDEIFDKGPTAVKKWQEAKVSALRPEGFPAMTLSEIIERLKKATGPDRELDYRIFCAFAKFDGFNFWHPEEGHKYTSSVDAAIALAEKVLPGKPVIMGWAQTPETRPWARVGAWNAADATGPTPALALVTAVVTALRAKQEGNQP